MASSSSSRPNRSPGPGNPIPYASCSAASQPAPTPSTARPPEITSSVVTALASSPGARNVHRLADRRQDRLRLADQRGVHHLAVDLDRALAARRCQHPPGPRDLRLVRLERLADDGHLTRVDAGLE